MGLLRSTSGGAVESNVALLCEDGRLCGHCGADIRTNAAWKGPNEFFALPDIENDGDGTGEPTLCPMCDAAGPEVAHCEDFRGELAPE
jgi:hypothetical protein